MIDRAIEVICRTLNADKVIIDGSVRDLPSELGANIQGGLFQSKRIFIIKYIDKLDKIANALKITKQVEGTFIFVLRETRKDVLSDERKGKFPKDLVDEIVYFDYLDDESRKGWLEDKLRKMGKAIPHPSLLDRMLQLLPKDLTSCYNEINKLELYTQGRRFLTPEDLLIFAGYSEAYVYEIFNDIMNSQPSYFSKFLTVYEDLDSPTYITSGFIYKILRDIQNRGKSSGKFSFSDMLRMLSLVANTDARLKSLSVNEKLLLMEMLVNLKVNAG